MFVHHVTSLGDFAEPRSAVCLRTKPSLFAVRWIYYTTRKRKSQDKTQKKQPFGAAFWRGAGKVFARHGGNAFR